MGRMDFRQSLRTISGFCAFAVNPFLKAVHRGDKESAAVAPRKTFSGMVPFLRASGAVLAIAIALILSATSNTHSQSGRQKPANSNSNSNDNNTRPRQVVRPGNSNGSTNQPANAPASKSG